MKFLEEMFNLLNANRQMPYYHAERRIDIYLNLFLTDILDYGLKKNGIEFIIPELALKKNDNNLSTKVDYLCFNKEAKHVYFVELKTDKKSISDNQFETYLLYTHWGRCMKEIKEINKATNHKAKFANLVQRLTETGLWNDEAEEYKISIIYLTPENKKIQKKIAAAAASDRVFEITFKTLENFIPKQFHDEWQLLYESVLKPIEENKK